MKAFTFSSGQIIGIDWDNAICIFFEMTNDGILGKNTYYWRFFKQVKFTFASSAPLNHFSQVCIF